MGKAQVRQLQWERSFRDRRISSYARDIRRLRDSEGMPIKIIALYRPTTTVVLISHPDKPIPKPEGP